jgi:hypothetical protein
MSSLLCEVVVGQAGALLAPLLHGGRRGAQLPLGDRWVAAFSEALEDPHQLQFVGALLPSVPTGCNSTEYEW